MVKLHIHLFWILLHSLKGQHCDDSLLLISDGDLHVWVQKLSLHEKGPWNFNNFCEQFNSMCCFHWHTFILLQNCCHALATVAEDDLFLRFHRCWLDLIIRGTVLYKEQWITAESFLLTSNGLNRCSDAEIYSIMSVMSVHIDILLGVVTECFWPFQPHLSVTLGVIRNAHKLSPEMSVKH